MSRMQLLKPKFEALARQMRGRHFGEVSRALRDRIDAIVARWRTESLLAVPELDRLPIAEFEDSMALILTAVATAMETDDPERLRRIIEHAPLHGGKRFRQGFTLETLLAVEATLRGAVIVELREHMTRPLDEAEAAALHELIGLMLDHSILAFVRRADERARRQAAGVQRLADLGTLVAGVAHDAANLLLPLRVNVERLKRCELPAEARSYLEVIEQVFQQHQSAILNLRWLSVDATHRPGDTHRLDLHAFGEEFRSFQRIMLPAAVELAIDIPEGLPPARISQAALSQVLFNLVTNAQRAILSVRQRGRITITARHAEQGWVQVLVEDDGPGMAPDVLERCMEPYFTTQEHGAGTGLGLPLVQSLIIGAGGTVEVRSPRPPDLRGDPPGPGGALFVLTLRSANAKPEVNVTPAAKAAAEDQRQG